MKSVVQNADLLIMVSDKPSIWGLLVDGDLVECEGKTVISIPASFIVSIHHWPTAALFATLCDSLKLTNNCFDFLTVSVFFK